MMKPRIALVLAFLLVTACHKKVAMSAVAPPPVPPALQIGEFNTEEYGLINENAFLEVLRHPLSTFSVDVDTASYTNLRRMLREGRLPPADAVRIEELINYFHYTYPDPDPSKPLSIVTEVGVCPWMTDRQLVLIGLKARSVPPSRFPANNLVFLIDVSGSMQSADKLPLLKKSFALLTEQLRAEDRVSIVVYAGAAGLILGPTSGAEKETILEAIGKLQAGGSTAGGEGIRLAYEVARQSFVKGGNNRVILATDGDFNVGVSSDGELVRLIESQRDSGVYLTVLGYGTGNLKDAKMERLADHGNGNYAYIDSLLEALRVLVQELGSTLVTVAKDVKLQVEFNPARVSAYRLLGYENRLLRDADFNDDAKDAGDVGSGHSVTALYEIIPAGTSEQPPAIDPLKYQQAAPLPPSFGKEILTLKVRYKEPTSPTSDVLTHVVEMPDLIGQASQNLRLAASIAEFGLLLRNSKYKEQANYENVVGLVESSLGPNDDGRQAEFLYLVKTAKSLSSQ